jgi:hypothetical protein
LTKQLHVSDSILECRASIYAEYLPAAPSHVLRYALQHFVDVIGIAGGFG